MTRVASYVPLWCKSNFSFLEGASHPEELVERAHALGLSTLAMVDRDGVYGAVRAHIKARELGMTLLLGSEFSVQLAGEACRVVALVRDRAGWRALCRLLTQGHGGKPKGKPLVVAADALGAASHGLVVICVDRAHPRLAQAARELAAISAHPGFMGLSRHWREDDAAVEHAQRQAAAEAGLACVAMPEVLYHDRARRPLQDVMTCIRHGITLSAAATRLCANSEHALADAASMAAQWQDDLETLARSHHLAALCTFSLGELRYRYPVETLPSGMSSLAWLRALCLRGVDWRYGGGHEAVAARRGAALAQLERELAIIEQLDYAGYFLTMHEIVQFCAERAILCQGRGSAANSVVCYVLGVTAIDPIEHQLLFERFLSLERAEPPDIDLDIEHVRREEVIAHVYQRYGRERAAMVCNVVRYRGRSARRDLGKVFGLGEAPLDALEAPLRRRALELCEQLKGMPRHLSIHPGGFLLGHEPVCELVPIEPATMEGRTVIQWDKDDIEALGLFKVDLLALGALTMVQRCFALLAETRGVTLTLATLPSDDAATYDLISRADTVGVFQIESRAQMSMLPRLRPRCFYDLVIEISLVRPGPISGGMVHPYLRRRQGKEEVTYPHPSLEPVLARTLGVPLFQEQVMRLAMVVADYAPGEADQLRRDMAAWKQAGRIEAHRDKLITRMVAKGITPEFAERVFNQIKGFGEYGFPESHAASFAIIAYATSYLRAHYLPEFTCALLNAQPMGFYSPATIVLDTKRHGTEVLPIDVNHSEVDCTVERLPSGALAVRLGLRWVKGLGRAAAARIAAGRVACSRYATVQSLMQTVGLSAADGQALAEAGAFSSMADIARRDAIWQVRGWDRQRHDALVLDSELVTPRAAPGFDALSRQEELLWDFEATGMSPTDHPMAPLRPRLRARGLRSSREVGALHDAARVRYVGQVICRQHPQTASGVTFMTLEDETGFVNVVIWPKIFARYQAMAETAAFLEVHGTLQVEEGVRHLIAERLYWPEIFQEHRASFASRDFH